jgi:hypothetical protein
MIELITDLLPVGWFDVQNYGSHVGICRTYSVSRVCSSGHLRCYGGHGHYSEHIDCHSHVCLEAGFGDPADPNAPTALTIRWYGTDEPCIFDLSVTPPQEIATLIFVYLYPSWFATDDELDEMEDDLFYRVHGGTAGLHLLHEYSLLATESVWWDGGDALWVDPLIPELEEADYERRRRADLEGEEEGMAGQRAR